MEVIIQQIAVRMVEQVLKMVEEKGIHDIGALVGGLLQIEKSSVLEMIKAILGEADAALVAARAERAKDGLRIKQRNVPRKLVTEIGELEYERTYFETKEGERYHLLDYVIGVEKGERVSKALSALLVQEATHHSMGKAAKNLGAAVSRQTVNNRVLALREVVKDAVPTQTTPRELHVFADEDHVHMKDGRSVIVPLVTVTEGIDTATRRHKTINPVHFEGYGMSNTSFFEGISSFLHKKYDMQRVECVYMHADGGMWIRTAKDWLPNVIPVMDGFHLEKRLRQISRLNGAAGFIHSMRKAMRSRNRDRFQEICHSIHAKQDERGKLRMTEHMNFLLNNWDAVVKRMSGTVCGSCTEPLVSHILSARLSRTPMAWSKHGLRQMAMLRVYVQNGESVSAKDIRISRCKKELIRDEQDLRDGFKKYHAYADRQIDDFFRKKMDWSIFQPTVPLHRKVDGTSVFLHACARLRDLSA